MSWIGVLKYTERDRRLKESLPQDRREGWKEKRRSSKIPLVGNIEGRKGRNIIPEDDKEIEVLEGTRQDLIVDAIKRVRAMSHDELRQFLLDKYGA